MTNRHCQEVPAVTPSVMVVPSERSMLRPSARARGESKTRQWRQLARLAADVKSGAPARVRTGGGRLEEGSWDAVQCLEDGFGQRPGRGGIKLHGHPGACSPARVAEVDVERVGGTGMDRVVEIDGGIG